MDKVKVGIIAGSGVDTPEFEFVEEITVKSKYGETSGMYKRFKHADTDVYYLRRHGEKHNIPPHMINYRANIDGFRQLGVSAVVSVSSVGGITSLFHPGDIAVTANAIDFTFGRNITYFHSDEVFHVDLTTPFCNALRERILSAAGKAGIIAHNRGVYICANGPRYETAAEIVAYSRLGADFVGMTLFPECALARELGICYANVSVISNYAAGITGNKLTSDEVIDTMKIFSESVKSILHQFISDLSTWECDCRNSLKGAKISNE